MSKDLFFEEQQDQAEEYAEHRHRINDEWQQEEESKRRELIELLQMAFLAGRSSGLATKMETTPQTFDSFIDDMNKRNLLRL